MRIRMRFGAERYDPALIPELVPQLVRNDGIRALHAAIADPDAWAMEPKVDGVRGLLVFDGERLERATGRPQARLVRGDGSRRSSPPKEALELQTAGST
jgi:hypothetical protein